MREAERDERDEAERTHRRIIACLGRGRNFRALKTTTTERFGSLAKMKLGLCVASLFFFACSGTPPNVDATPDAAAPHDDAGAPPADDASAPQVEASVEASTPQPCTYPKGPYGPGTGQVVSPNLTWQGYAANDASVTTLSTNDLFDCDGKKGIDAIVIDVSAGWCAACETQASDEAQLTAQYDSLHIKAVTLLIMDAAENPATTDTALDWRTTYKLDDVGVYADPNFLLQPDQQTIGLPITMVVDPRTMKVVEVTEGYGQEHPPVIDASAVSLAKKNE